MIVQERAAGDLRPCVDELQALHVTDGYPTYWPQDPAGWLSPAGLAAAWVGFDAGETVLGHVCVVGDVDDPVVAALVGVPVERLVSVWRLFGSPAARGRGLSLGAALLVEVQRWSEQRGLQLMLDVVDDGAPAVGLDEWLGWRLVWTVKMLTG